MIADIDELRRRATLIVAGGGWLASAFLAVAALGGNREVLVAAICSGIATLVVSWIVIRQRTDNVARLIVGIVAAIQPIAVLVGVEGDMWQMDLHIFFFIALVTLPLLLDIRPIIAACAIQLFHDAAFAFLPIASVTGSDGTVFRTVVHGMAVLLVCWALCWISLSLSAIMAKIEADRLYSQQQSEELQATTSSLEEAIRTINREQEEAERARNAAQEERRAAYEGIAAQFEKSVVAVTTSVASTAKLLQRSAHDLKLLADKAGDEARDVAGGAETASRAANTVAAGVAELSLSIAEVAVHAGQQTELTGLATERSGGGGEAIGSLAQHSRTIGQATRAIARIAERTNLLSLNATIEAASAGEAGRGFSTVAFEVKQLADQAAQAAKEIDNFLTGVKTGTLEAERSFKAIDAAIGELGEAANSIRLDVENQRQSADTIQSFARSAAGEADAMAEQTQALAKRAKAASELSAELDRAALDLADNVRNLEASTRSFNANLQAA